MKNHIKTLVILSALALATSVQAQITYVDATDGASGNTTAYTNGSWQTWNAFVGQTWAANDGVWDKRAFGNGATIFQNSAAGAIDTNAVRLDTTVSGLALNTYEAYVYFWSDSSMTWQIGASLSDTPGQLTLYKPGGANVTQLWTGADGTVYSTSLAVNPFTTAVMIAEGNRRLFQVDLGSFTGTSVDFFLEVDRQQLNQDYRTWYDGVGIPEPSSLALLGGALLVLGVIRRRK